MAPVAGGSIPHITSTPEESLTEDMMRHRSLVLEREQVVSVDFENSHQPTRMLSIILKRKQVIMGLSENWEQPFYGHLNSFERERRMLLQYRGSLILR